MRATRPPRAVPMHDSSCAPAHSTPLPFKRSPPASFKRLLGGFREAEDVAVRVLNVEVQCAPRTLLKRLGDRSPAPNQLGVERPDLGHVKEGIEVLSGPAVGSFGVELGSALEMDRNAVSRHARVEIAVDEVRREAEALFV